MQKTLYLMLCAVLIAGGLFGCTSDNKTNIEETIFALSNLIPTAISQ